jgi:antitoxin component YwqK of YwqJK toxin-antitoxin module
MQFDNTAQNVSKNQRIHGKKDGYWVKHRLNGSLKWEGYFVKGQKTGYWKIYNKKGNLHSEGYANNGYRIGNWYLVHTKSGTKLDMTKWDGHGHLVGGATLHW